MTIKAIGQVVYHGSKIVAKAFTDAYKQAAVNKATTAATAAATRNPAEQQKKQWAMLKYTGMPVKEAQQILNVEPEATLEEVTKKFNHLYKVNEKAVGGSFYLQSKAVRAKETLQAEIERKEFELEEKEKPKDI